ncbi:MAG: spondin domain-containing protein [Planctomycetota bacterium]
MKRFCSAAALITAFLFASDSTYAQQDIQITVENLQPADGFYFTPVWLGFHDGSFDLFDEGAAASSALEALAEEGDVAGVRSDFASVGGQDVVVTDFPGFGGAPVFDPGNSQSVAISLGAQDRFVNFATMIIPSNDSFFGNQTSLELLDSTGGFLGDRVIELTLADLWDAGTELNDGLGAAFSATGGTSTDTNGFVTRGPDLSNFDTTSTAAGSTIDFASASGASVVRISFTAVPEPGSAVVLGLGALGLMFVRKRRRI